MVGVGGCGIKNRLEGLAGYVLPALEGLKFNIGRGAAKLVVLLFSKVSAIPI